MAQVPNGSPAGSVSGGDIWSVVRVGLMVALAAAVPPVIEYLSGLSFSSPTASAIMAAVILLLKFGQRWLTDTTKAGAVLLALAILAASPAIAGETLAKERSQAPAGAIDASATDQPTSEIAVVRLADLSGRRLVVREVVRTRPAGRLVAAPVRGVAVVGRVGGRGVAIAGRGIYRGVRFVTPPYGRRNACAGY